MRRYTNRAFLDALKERVLVFDGAMGTSLQAQNLTSEHFGGEQHSGCIDYLVISFPEAVELVHRGFLEVGVDVIETDTFRANRLTLGEYRLADKVHEINFKAAQLARELADEYSTEEQPRFVAGSIGPTGKLPSAEDPELSDITFDQLVDIFEEQAVGLIQGGVDLIIIETSQDILEVKATITGIQRAFDKTGVFLPIQAQVTLDTSGRMLLGTDAGASLAVLEGMPVDVIGLNCSTGPEHMREPIDFLGEYSTLPVSCIPNAGLPLNVDGEAVYPLEPEPFALALQEFVEKYGISVVGGCCGTTPAHLKALVDKLKDHPHPPRPKKRVPRLASSTTSMLMHQDPPPLLIGERCNAQGSRKFKRILLAEDFDTILNLAREQVENGAHALDISVAVTERADEIELMNRVVKKIAMGVEVPLVIDTTEPAVMESALKIAPGRCMLNSTHLEGGRQKADLIFELARRFNAVVMVLTIDEIGMAKSATRKLEAAEKIYDIAVNEYGLSPEDLVFDTLTFTLATGDPEFANSAVDTLNGIKLIKEKLPGVLTSLGVSNVSFGLAKNARPVVNSVMLYHAVRAGLDMAIVNPVHITPYSEIPENEKLLAEDLLFNRSEDALERLIEYYEKTTAISQKTVIADPTEGMTPQERLSWRVLHRYKDGIVEDIDELLNLPGEESRHDIAVELLNTVLLPAMKEVGDRFGTGELILPFVLQSAEVMKMAVSHLETYLEKKDGTSKGVVVLATVYGDVHDIGKNLVKTILANNGYEVIDLGKQVPVEQIISSVVDNKADAVGLSALLVSTSKQMPRLVNEMQRRSLEVPVLIGGAAINRKFGRRILFTEDGEPYKAGVYYCKDAFEGLNTLEELMNPTSRVSLQERALREAEMELGINAKPKIQTDIRLELRLPSAEFIPQPKRWGVRVVRSMPLELVLQHLSIKELFRLSWGAKNARGVEWERLEKEYSSRLDSMKKEALQENWLIPQGVYGIFPARSEKNSLILYDPNTINADQPNEITRFDFPRQAKGKKLCLADYFLPVASDQFDVAVLQVVTVGREATRRFDQYQEKSKYSEGYFTHGLAVQTAEATAEYLHHHIRKELGLKPDQGKRYSWGYPAIPDLSDHSKVFELLPVEDELGMSLTSAFQLVPEQSTAAIIIHHPKATYFSLGKSRISQLTD